jgi:DsbC/DsbD-like thiol-disulfide interchange protein
MLRLAGGVIVALLILPSSSAQQGTARPGADAHSSETKHLKLTTSVGPDTASAGKIHLFLDVVPKPKMHVYAPGQEGYIGVAVSVETTAGVTPEKPQFPKPEKVFFKPLNETQLVYSKPFRIVQDVMFTRDASAAAGGAPVTIKGTLRYQACDDKVCYLPQTVPVEWTVASKQPPPPRLRRVSPERFARRRTDG